MRASSFAREMRVCVWVSDSGGMGFDLLYDFAQPYSITLICRLLGVPTDRQRDLLDWSHRHVKMYEFDVPVDAAQAANDAAAEFQNYVRELIEERREHPRDDMVTALVQARVDGGRLSDGMTVHEAQARAEHRVAERGTRGIGQHARERDADVRATP